MSIPPLLILNAHNLFNKKNFWHCNFDFWWGFDELFWLAWKFRLMNSSEQNVYSIPLINCICSDLLFNGTHHTTFIFSHNEHWCELLTFFWRWRLFCCLHIILMMNLFLENKVVNCWKIVCTMKWEADNKLHNARSGGREVLGTEALKRGGMGPKF